ncbi:TM2 domain-containing protein [Clostridium culturomicium]|uniref:TM2 domain-containing protein n=1 Tax=Clostridium culturomicium TaxID=1499683 RepID=UPI000AAAF421|nr:TM2 domain-containing protein [Clostridium culturomicium]
MNYKLDFFLCLILGMFGAHKFYEKKAGMGVLYLFTFGIFGFGWMFDVIKLFVVAFIYTEDKRREYEIKEKKKSEEQLKKSQEYLQQVNAKKQVIDERKAEAHRAGLACCPYCGSTSITAHKKGYGVGKAVVGASVAGGLGLMAGNIGAKKVNITCLNCGKQFKPGQR